MKKLLLPALLSIVATASFAAPPPPPAPRIVVLDRVAILQFSKVGKDIARQLLAMNNQTKSSYEASQKALAAEGQALRQQVAILAADVRQKREDDFNNKVRNAEESAQRRALQIQEAGQVAQQAVAQALSPLIEQIVKERGANIVLDKQSVVFASSNAFEITADAIARLDAKLSSYKVVLGAKLAPPAPPAAQKK
jgi:Skp family chaperone for outer membrane proteins